MPKYSADQIKISIIDEFIGSSLFAFLVNDVDNTLDDASSMEAAAALEILEQNGYRRQLVSLPQSIIRLTNDYPPQRIATCVATEIKWTATGNMPTFTKICYARNATGNRADPVGVLIMVEHANHNDYNNPITVSLVAGQSYQHTATFEVGGEII